MQFPIPYKKKRKEAQKKLISKNHYFTFLLLLENQGCAYIFVQLGSKEVNNSSIYMLMLNSYNL